LSIVSQFLSDKTNDLTEIFSESEKIMLIDSIVENNNL
jgi:hypothetical protein